MPSLLLTRRVPALRRAVLVLMAACTPLLTFSLLPKAAGAATATTTPSTLAPVHRVLASKALASWLYKYGGYYNGIRTDYVKVYTLSAETPIPLTQISNECTVLAKDANAATHYKVVPESHLKKPWKTLVKDAVQLAKACKASVAKKFKIDPTRIGFFAIENAMVEPVSQMLALELFYNPRLEQFPPKHVN